MKYTGGEYAWWITLYKLVGKHKRPDSGGHIMGNVLNMSVPYLSTIRHTGNTNTAVITLPHTGNKDSDRLVQSGNASSAGSYIALQIDWENV